VGKQSISVGALLARIRNMEQHAIDLVNEKKALERHRKEVFQAIREAYAYNQRQIERLCRVCSQAPSHETVQFMTESSAGPQLSSSTGEKNASTTVPDVSCMDPMFEPFGIEPPKQLSTVVDRDDAAQITEKTSAPDDKRDAVDVRIENDGSSSARGSSLEITQQEFESIPTSVRSRCKLTDVNKIFGLVVKHFAGKSKSERLQPLNVRELSGSGGVRTVGNSAQAALNTLRSLRKIAITKNGVLLFDVFQAEEERKKKLRNRLPRT